MARVLLVDDDRADLMLLQQALQEASPGLEVVPARTHAEVMAEAHGVDLILMDLNMPGTSGFELIEEIRRTDLTPIVVLTTSAADGDVERAYDLGANAFITKPADLVETIEAMQVLCDFWLEHVRVPEGS